MLQPISESPDKFAKNRLIVPRPKFPKALKIGEELGKGSNNRVFLAKMGEEDCVLRAPRRRSDTQQRGSAVWEFRHTLKASHLGVGPVVYDAWCARHAHDGWSSGLYMITESLPYDLDRVLTRKPDLRKRAVHHREAIGKAVVKCLTSLAENLIFVYDLKPNNLMVRFPEEDEENPQDNQDNQDNQVDVRVIDFGRDFCEWAGCEQDPDSRTPIIDMLRKRIRASDKDLAPKQVDAIVSHVLFATMLVQVAATTTQALYDDRRDHKMTKTERRDANPMVSLAIKLLKSMQGRNIALVREVLRTDDVRGVMAHYHSRRNSGTRRTFRYSRGEEV